MATIFTFSGQGAQRPGMLASLPDSRAVSDTLAQAADVLSCAMADLDSVEALADTRSVQLALTVVGVAAARHLAAEGAPADGAMGLSIGAWPAAVTAGVIEFEDALQLVAERGRLMAEAFPSGYGMSAIIGLGEARVRALIAGAGGDEASLYVGNVNSDQQIVVAGADAALATLADTAGRAGASRVQRLDMAVPSHCALLDAPADALDDIANKSASIEFRAPRLAYFSANARRRLWQAAAIRDDLIYNMARTVYWSASAAIAHESGFSLAVEMPPARVLTNLHPATDSPGEAVAVIDAGWHNAAALIRREASTA